MQQEINNQLNLFKYIRNYLKNNPGIETLIPAITNLGNGSVSTQITEYNKTLLNRNNIRSNSSYQNPLVKDLDAAAQRLVDLEELQLLQHIGFQQCLIQLAVGAKRECSIGEDMIGNLEFCKFLRAKK